MTVADLLKRKQGKVITCGEANNVGEAAELITRNSVGALPVTEGKTVKIVGIISERDIARALSEHGAAASAKPVTDLMTRDVTVIGPDESVKQAMRTMGRLTIRHLPVVQEGNLLGVISQRDVLKAILDDTQLEVDVLRDVAMKKL